MQISIKKERGISSYVPEAVLLDGKDGATCRVCREDCAVLDARNGYAVVAYRGHTPLLGSDFFSYARLDDSEYLFMQSASKTHARLLLNSSRGALLIFADHLEQTGLITVLLPNLQDVSNAAPSLRHALARIDRSDVLVSPSITERRLPLNAKLCEWLEEQFFYIDAFLIPRPLSNGFYRAASCIARFAGCRLGCAYTATDKQDVHPDDQIRFADFLLCTLLTLRQRDTAVSAKNVTDTVGAESVEYVICAASTQTAPLDGNRSREAFPFLACECFSDFGISMENETFCLHAPLHSATPMQVNSIDGTPVVFPLLLERVS